LKNHAGILEKVGGAKKDEKRSLPGLPGYQPHIDPN
jgi:hypothetical protein